MNEVVSALLPWLPMLLKGFALNLPNAELQNS